MIIHLAFILKFYNKSEDVEITCALQKTMLINRS